MPSRGSILRLSSEGTMEEGASRRTRDDSEICLPDTRGSKFPDSCHTVNFFAQRATMGERWRTLRGLGLRIGGRRGGIGVRWSKVDRRLKRQVDGETNRSPSTRAATFTRG